MSNVKGQRSLRGQILVEAIVAISILTVGLLGIFSLLSRSLSLNRTVAEEYIAANLAGEGIELVKNLIDRNVIQSRPWNEGITFGDREMDYDDTVLGFYSDRPLSFDAATGYYSYDVGSPTVHKRKIIVEQPSPDEIKVNSLVSWTTRGGGQFEVNLEDHFFYWR